MARALKVYGGNVRGQWRGVIAASSGRDAMRRIHDDNGYYVGAAHFRDYWCETGNETEIAQAMSEPGTLFTQSNRGNIDANPWFKWKDRH